jgi:hypothetical protein
MGPLFHVSHGIGAGLFIKSQHRGACNIQIHLPHMGLARVKIWRNSRAGGKGEIKRGHASL